MTQKQIYIYAVIYCVFFSFPAFALPSDTRDDETRTINGFLDWVNIDINAEVRLNLYSINAPLPGGRVIAEERLFSEYFDNIQPFIHSIPVDSSSKLGDFVDRGELAPAMVDNLAFEADMVPPSISTDLRNITAAYKISLSEVSSALIRHRRAAEFDTPVDAKTVTSYSGIVIIAAEPLSVHGRKTDSVLVPCLFPKIWDTEMNLIFDKKNTDPALFRHSTMVHYFGKDHIFRHTPSGLSPEIEKVVGNKPLRIIARGIFGVNPTDPVIDKDDALVILSSDANRRLLREGRVAIITTDDVLKKEL